jgi:uncharacterized protein
MEYDVVLAQVVDKELRPWGFWATVALSLAVMGVYLVVQVVVTVAFMVIAEVGRHAIESHEAAENLVNNGLLLSLGAWSALPFTLGLIVVFVRLCGTWRLRDYLALRRVPVKTLCFWLVVILFYGAAYETATWFAGHTAGEKFMINIYQTAGFVPLLWLTLAVEAPLFEEIFFRGFMFQGIQQSRLGGVGATLLTSLAWTVVHVQYDVYDLAFIFGLGIVLGIARARYGSVYLTMAMHALVNLVSLVQMQFLAAG